MIYAVFLCFAFAGRQDLGYCERQGWETYQTKDVCEARIERARPIAIEGEFTQGSLRGLRTYRCLGKPTWTDGN